MISFSLTPLLFSSKKCLLFRVQANNESPMKLLLSLTLLISILLSCKIEVTESNSEYLRENPPTVGNYCSFNPLDGECTYYNDNNSVLCSMGKCNEGDCITGKGVLTYPSGTTLETNFKKGSMEDSEIFPRTKRDISLNSKEN